MEAPPPSRPSSDASDATEPAKAYSEDGVDVSLIHWMLELSPLERLEAAQDMIDTVWMLREGAEA